MLNPPQSIEARLESTVRQLAEIGPRNLYHLPALERAGQEIEGWFTSAGCETARQVFEARGASFANIVADVPGWSRHKDVLVIGAHYDTHKNSPGANDNGSGIAALVELARSTALQRRKQHLRFVAFTNEETPFTRTSQMGSYVYAQACKARGDAVRGMLCLETIGCWSTEVGLQRLSLGGLLLPRRGDFLAVIGNRRSRPLLNGVSAALRSDGSVPIQSRTLPTHFPGAASSDHWSFWKEGFPAVMLTDTAPLRYRHYHTREDTPDKIDFSWLARVVNALNGVIGELGRAD